MLTKPKCGWTNVKINNFEAPASFITDVPIDCLKNMIFALKNKSDFIVSLDAEGWTYKIISDSYRTLILIEDEEPETIVLNDITKEYLAKELYLSIYNYKEDWYNFPCFVRDKDLPKEERETEAYNKYKKQINYLLKSLKERINELC